MCSEVNLIFEELLLDGEGIIGRRRKDGKWNANTYRILKELQTIAGSNGMLVEFNPEFGSVKLKEKKEEQK